MFVYVLPVERKVYVPYKYLFPMVKQELARNLWRKVMDTGKCYVYQYANDHYWRKILEYLREYGFQVKEMTTRNIRFAWA